MKIIIAESYSHIGAIRETNEDSIFKDIELGLFIVADGIGGQNSGEVASAIAVNTLVGRIMDDRGNPSLDILREGFYEANHKINVADSADKMNSGMGTTMTAALTSPENIYLGHVGDSRAYLINAQKITRLTEDHSLAGELLRDGSITQEEAANHPQKNVLTRALGQNSLVLIDEAVIPWQKGDYLLLCSDGLYNLVSDLEIQDLLLKAKSIKEAVRILVETALQRGGYDNISVVIAYHE